MTNAQLADLLEEAARRLKIILRLRSGYVSRSTMAIACAGCGEASLPPKCSVDPLPNKDKPCLVNNIQLAEFLEKAAKQLRGNDFPSGDLVTFGRSVLRERNGIEIPDREYSAKYRASCTKTYRSGVYR